MDKKERHHRKSIRLKGYDYQTPGYYFVTICANKRQCLFGNVINQQMQINNFGKMVNDVWHALPRHYYKINIDEFVVMPNHFHGIIQIVGAGSPRPNMSPPPNDTMLTKHKMDNNLSIMINNQHHIKKGRGNRAPTLGQIVAYFKYGTTKQINLIRKIPGVRLWQRNYYEHIIRNEHDLNRARQYIHDNPKMWNTDPNNI